MYFVKHFEEAALYKTEFIIIVIIAVKNVYVLFTNKIV